MYVQKIYAGVINPSHNTFIRTKFDNLMNDLQKIK